MLKRFVLRKGHEMDDLEKSEYKIYVPAFTDEMDQQSIKARKDTCGKLGVGKEAVCHPSGPKSPPAPTCYVTDRDEDLIEKQNKFVRCADKRHLQNRSNCYQKGTKEHKTHELAEKIIAGKAKRCKEILDKRKKARRSKSKSRSSSSRKSFGKGAGQLTPTRWSKRISDQSRKIK